MTSEFFHTPVMLAEAIEWLAPAPGKRFIDATVGMGGHAAALLEKTAPDGRLLGIDRDERALAIARQNLVSFGARVVLVHAGFDDIDMLARRNAFECVDGVIADLGVLSMQLDDAGRGFSFMRDGPLDMRMDAARGESAADLIAGLNERELADLIYRFGEERLSRRIARRIVAERERGAIITTARLARIVAGAYPPRRRGIHPATRTFQALRIAVNDELGMLERFLEAAPGLLKDGGRLVMISYHSLEDRQIKHAFRELSHSMGLTLTKKVLSPSPEEVGRNPRARSAKMRVFERRTTGDERWKRH